MNVVPIRRSLAARSLPTAEEPPKQIVLLDDDLGMLRALERLLVRGGFRVTATQDPRQALEAVVCRGADAIISDLYMPDLGGNVILAMVAKAAPGTARVLLTSETDFHAVANLSLPFSVDAFIPKRDVSARLVGTLRQLLGQRLGESLVPPPDQARALALSLLRSLTPPKHHSHCERVAAWAAHLATAMGLPATQVLDIELGGLLHDIGDLGLREGLLDKPAPLSAAEEAEMHRHPEVGAALIADLFMLRRAIPVVLGHHERVDGTGYPRGLAGNQIPIEARVFQIADAYDAIRRGRPFRGGSSDAEARAQIGRHVGLQLDREIHDAFTRIPPEEWSLVVAHLSPP